MKAKLFTLVAGCRIFVSAVSEGGFDVDFAQTTALWPAAFVLLSCLTLAPTARAALTTNDWTWMTGLGKTNALERTAGNGGGGFATNSFTTFFTVTNTVGTVTNYLNVGAATNFPSRYYRVRVVP